ncbi:MAG: NAD-dependent epimerase/dehydratase family protein [Alphaproteobacteria bacterium]
MNEKSIIITGATGFIGTNLCLRLLAQNHQIFAIDNHNSSSKQNLQSIKNFILQQNISVDKFHFLEKNIIEDFVDLSFFQKQKIDFIFNLACPASPPRYQQDPIYTFKTSVWGNENLINLAKKLQKNQNYYPTLIFTSTSEIYGDALIHPQPEGYWGNVNPVGIRSCYDEGKRASETLLYGYHRTENLPIKILRIFNTYGEFMDKNDGRVVSNFINQALRNQDITIYGDGSQTRSFCYIDDLLEIMCKFALANDNFFGPINCGNPQEFCVKDLAKLVIELTNSKSQIKYLQLPQDDPKQRCPDISLAYQKYLWAPKIDLKIGLKNTIKYFQSLEKNLA